MPHTGAVLSYPSEDPFVVADVRVDDPRGDEILVMAFRHCGGCVNCMAGRPAYCRKAVRVNQFGARADGSARICWLYRACAAAHRWRRQTRADMGIDFCSR